MANDQQVSASSGDWVSARLDTRDATTVEGVLYLRYVPALASMPLTYASWCQYFDHGIPGVEHAAVAGLFSVEAVATAAFLHAWVAAAAAAGVEPLADLGEGFAQCAS